MGREALLAAALSWLTISGAVGVQFGFRDSLGAAGAQLYRNTRAYAPYAAPYGAYTFQLPSWLLPATAATTTTAKPPPPQPAQQGSPSTSYQSVQTGTNWNLKDSYGNKFVQSVQAMPFKPFPQQFVQLQALPAHFAQPLAAPVSSYQFNQVPGAAAHSSQQFARLPLQAAPTPINYSFVHPGVYADAFKNLRPTLVSPAYPSAFQGKYLQMPLQPYKLPVVVTPGPLPQQQEYTRVVSINHEVPAVQQQEPTSNKATYADTHSHEYAVQSQEIYTERPRIQHYVEEQAKYHHYEEKPKYEPYEEDKPKYQQYEEPAPDTYEEEAEEEEPLAPAPPRHVYKKRPKTKVTSIRETPVPTVVNGKRTVVNVKTKPPIPLLDVSLLEPLTFDNPLVPQVQHYLPRIKDAKYHKLSDLEDEDDDDNKKPRHKHVAHKTKSYGHGKHKGKKVGIKRKPRPPPRDDDDDSYDDDYIPQATARPTVTIQAPDDSPEITYEINTPNRKEIYKEKSIKYTKETKSVPETYSYDSTDAKEPVHYSYAHNSKEPAVSKEVRYSDSGEGPNQHTHKLKSEVHRHPEQNHKQESDDSKESSDQPGDEVSIIPKSNYHHHQHHHHKETPKSSPSDGPEHREQDYHPKHSTESHNSHHDEHLTPTPQYYTTTHAIHPLGQDEENIHISAPLKSSPHAQLAPKRKQHHQQQHQPQPHSHDQPSPHHETKPTSSAPTAHVQEKTQQVYIKEVTPDHSKFGEDIMKAMFGNEEDEKELDFERAYKNAAYGFPAYDKPSEDAEKDIYSPEAYGVAPRDHHEFKIDHSPFQQYTASGDRFPKEMTNLYRDDLGKTKENYFLDYSISKPESLTDRYTNKVNYFKLYDKQKPAKAIPVAVDGKPKQSAKLSVLPYGLYPVQDPKMKQYLTQYKPAAFFASPMKLEYEYSKGSPRDSSAFATQPLQKLQMRTQLVEPQYQFGFEPVALPRLLDSELAALPSNLSAETDGDGGVRKKVYAENFYVKKTSLSNGSPSSR